MADLFSGDVNVIEKRLDQLTLEETNVSTSAVERSKFPAIVPVPKPRTRRIAQEKRYKICCVLYQNM